MVSCFNQCHRTHRLLPFNSTSVNKLNMVVTRSLSRRASESFESNISKKNVIPPPWCSLAKVHERKKPKKVALQTWETRSLSPLRENTCEYLHGDKRKLYKRKHSRACCKQTPARNKGCGKTLISLAFLFISVGMIIALWMSNYIPETALLTKIIPRTNLISLLSLEQTSVDEECCSRVKYLVAELLRAEQTLKSTLRLRRTLMLTSRTNSVDASIDRGQIEGVIVTRGKDTKEWGSRVALWGVVPLWRAAPPPDTVLSLRKPVPSDCWPFSGSYGELHIELPRKLHVRCISVEHVHPDTAWSAPKHFILYGTLANGTWLKLVDGEYKNRGPAKQYYSLLNQNIPLQHLVFRVLSNQGNPRYTCIYRLHLYENIGPVYH